MNGINIVCLLVNLTALGAVIYYLGKLRTLCDVMQRFIDKD